MSLYLYLCAIICSHVGYQTIIHLPFTHSPFTHSPFTHSPFTHSPFTHSPFAHSPFTHSLTLHSFTLHSLTHSLTHPSLTHPLTRYLPTITTTITIITSPRHCSQQPSPAQTKGAPNVRGLAPPSDRSLAAHPGG